MSAGLLVCFRVATLVMDLQLRRKPDTLDTPHPRRRVVDILLSTMVASILVRFLAGAALLLAGAYALATPGRELADRLRERLRHAAELQDLYAGCLHERAHDTA